MIDGLLWTSVEVDPRDSYPGFLRYHLSERTERGFDALPRLRTRHDRWGVVLLVKVVRVLVRGHPLLLEEVHLVPDDHHRDLPDEPPHHRHPVLLHGAAGVLPPEVVGEQDAPGSLHPRLPDPPPPLLPRGDPAPPPSV